MGAALKTQASAGRRAFRPGPFNRSNIEQWAPATIAVITVLLLWEAVCRTGLVDQRHVPAMSQTVGELGHIAITPWFWTAVWNTLLGWVLGISIAVGLAIPLGLIIGSSGLLYRALRVPIEFMRPIPSVALVPVALLVYGVGLESKVFLAVFAAFWPLFVQTLYGVQDVDPVAIDTGRSFGLGRVERLYRIKLPSAVPYIATGIRISSSVALILVVTAELVIGSAGLGREINLARAGAAYPMMYALIFATGTLGWLLNKLAAAGERRVLHWHPSQRALT